MKNKKILLLIVPIVAILLELLPYGAVLNFANPEGEPWRHTYSYFSLTPFGYANFGPFLTALLTCVLVILSLVAVFKPGKTIVNTIKTASIIGFCTSLMPLMFGIRFMSVIGGFISILLLLETILTLMIRFKK